MPKENVDLLTRQTKIYNFAASMHWIPVLGQVEDEIVNCFKKGGGGGGFVFHIHRTKRFMK
ncbi:MAG: hypothetical protein ACR2F1_08045 [Nitrososphaeraceae archaeon]